MTIGRYLLHFSLILGLTLAVGCSSPEPEVSPEQPAVPENIAEMPEVPSADAAKAEGSAPKSELEPAGEEGVVEAAADDSMHDATEYDDGGILEGLVPEGWKQTGPIEHYNVARLYNKVNGRSELYMAYDVRGLGWVSFVREDDPSNFLDLFVYDMQSPTDAFGIFSVEREPGQAAIPVGREGYRTRSNYYFMQGKWYGYVNASQENDKNTETGLGILIALMQRLEDDGSPVAGLDWLPEEGLIQDTVQYFKVDAMSLDFLTETFLGQYEIGDDTARAFISRRASAEEAAEIVTAFDAYGTDYADGVSTAEVAGTEVHFADWGGDYYDVMFHVGSTVAGLTNVEGRERADRVLQKLIPQIK